jgi:hypothetical protein
LKFFCGDVVDSLKISETVKKIFFVATSDLDLDPENTSGFGQNVSDPCGSGSMIL